MTKKEFEAMALELHQQMFPNAHVVKDWRMDSMVQALRSAYNAGLEGKKNGYQYDNNGNRVRLRGKLTKPGQYYTHHDTCRCKEKKNGRSS